MASTDSVAVDAHALIWYLFDPEALSTTAADLIETAAAADGIVVPAISLLEVVYLAEKSDRGITAANLDDLLGAVGVADSPFVVAPFDVSVAKAARATGQQDLGGAGAVIGDELVTRHNSERIALAAGRLKSAPVREDFGV